MKTREHPVVIRPDDQPHTREDPMVIRSDDRQHSATMICGLKPNQHGNTVATATGIPIIDMPRQPKSVGTQPTSKRTDRTLIWVRQLSKGPKGHCVDHLTCPTTSSETFIVMVILVIF
jgi:hypothetical protein